jgi:dTMP kinase
MYEGGKPTERRKTTGEPARVRAEEGPVMRLHPGDQYRGKLFVVEGIDGSGKSTQISLLHKWLLTRGHSVFFSEWNSSPLVKRATSRGKRRHLLQPLTFSLIHATDFADRTERSIIPPLKAGAAVLADRYVYTAFARDGARGCDREWVRELYSFAVQPTVALYFRVPLEVALDRILAGRPELKWYEAGMDLGLSDDIYESFKRFQARILEEYDRICEEFGLTVIDGTLPIGVQQQQVREIVEPLLDNILKRPDDGGISPPGKAGS